MNGPEVRDFFPSIGGGGVKVTTLPPTDVLNLKFTVVPSLKIPYSLFYEVEDEHESCTTF